MAERFRKPDDTQQRTLDGLRIELAKHSDLPRIGELLKAHHYLGDIHPVGERLYYLATDPQGGWLAILVFCAAARHLRHRDQWIGWTSEQRRRRLALVANNARFLILPEGRIPNLASKVLQGICRRVSSDWEATYGHPILVLETFVDPEQFTGAIYRVTGWTELGLTDGWGRRRLDYYVRHDKPKRLFVKALAAQATGSLQAEHLKPALAKVEAAVPPRSTVRAKDIGRLVDHFKVLPEYRERVESYPRWSLATILLLAVLCEAPRGQKDLEKFARGFNQAQRRALGIRPNRQGRCPSPSQATFSRFLSRVDAAALEATLLRIQTRIRGGAPAGEIVVMDGKEPRHGSGASILSAVTVPGQYYLGSAVVCEKTNEIPVAQQLIPAMDLEGRLVSLDALHTQAETARTIVMDAGGDYLLTVKKNQPKLLANILSKVSAPRADFPPGEADAEPGTSSGEQQGAGREPIDPHHRGGRGEHLLPAGTTGGAAASKNPRAEG